MHTRFPAVLLAMLMCLHPVSVHAGESDIPQNIILFIGDGMGVSHITAAKVVGDSLNLERFRTTGLLTTFPLGGFITESAASGTALATGYQTYRGAVSVSHDGKPLKTVLEYAEERGMATGLVATCSITHATPAVFAAHVASRRMQGEIAAQMVSSGVDVLFGGGWAYFVPQSAAGSKRKDDRDLLEELGRRMTVLRSVEEFREFGGRGGVAGLFTPAHPPAADKRPFTLEELTTEAIRILSRDENGFFLMVEGSQIDWAAHEHEEDGIILEMLDFDDAVGAGLDFAEQDGSTLVITTSDHETGGFAVHDGSLEERRVTESGFTTDGHTAAMIPVFAFGPGSDDFGGIQDNTVVGRIMIRYVLAR